MNNLDMNNIDNDINKLYMQYFELLYNLNRYYPNEVCQNYIDKFKELDINIMLARFVKIFQKYEKEIKENYNDSIMLNNDIMLLPELNIKNIWSNLNENQKTKTWLNIRIIYLKIKILLEEKENIIEQIDPELEKQEKQKNLENLEKEEFIVDPILGVGEDNNNYDIEKLLKGTDTLDNSKIEKPSLGSFIKMTGGIVDINKIFDSLKNLSNEDIESATQTINSLINKDCDPKAQEFIKQLLDETKTLLSETDFNEGDTFKKMESLYTNLAKNMFEKMSKNPNQPQLNFNNLFDTNKLMEEIGKDKNSGIDKKQIGVLNNLMAGLTQNPNKINNKSYMNNMFSQLGVNPNEVNKMMKNMKNMNKKK
ncbi:hypothetical protein Hokovirus_2_101 [Hokovirus HKV1]|uniref:Uncharacterized protein n=1 Tax=Hokovirus HKV1 TaxID=1977638 RepID=A0A1V0SG04_9VIRU|nr:hypothetical protein Hokovirus_2_101 [Hokovirus HKV1]